MKKQRLTHAQRLYTEEQLKSLQELHARKIHEYNTAKTTEDALEAIEYAQTITKIIAELEIILKRGCNQ